MDYYIYYRVHEAQAALLIEKVLPMQAVLQQQYQIDTALKRRPTLHNGCQTWMEVYLGAPEAFDAALAEAAAAAEIAPYIDGERHTDCFMAVVL